jgi:hypothetical protein
VFEEVKEEEGSKFGVELEAREGLYLYEREVTEGCGRSRSWRRRSRARRGKLRCASGRRRLGGASARDGVLNDGLWRAGDGGVLAVPRRKVLIMAWASVLPRASGRVQEGTGVVVIAHAREEKGEEDERLQARQSPGGYRGMPVHALACTGRGDHVWPELWRLPLVPEPCLAYSVK